jgi:excisionase family DNA binding protein
MKTKSEATVDPRTTATPYLRAAEACRYLGISRRCLSGWMRRRMIPYRKVGSRCCLFVRQELDEALARFKIGEAGRP